MTRAFVVAAGFVAAVSAAAFAAAPPPSAAPGSASPAGSVAAPPASARPVQTPTCTEHIPQGKQRPVVSETIPSRATSGHALLLRVVIQHGPGERVLPSGFRLESGSEEAKALDASRFYLPETDGGAGPKLSRSEGAGTATTTVDLRFVPLPDKPGRNQLVLPPLPIAIARASGELVRICTAPHPVTVEDPIANDPNPKPKGNPEPRRQREIWETAKYATIAAGVAAVLGALAALFVSWWRRRPRPVPPATPPRPPWEVALESLFDLRHSGLLEDQRLAELYDRVSDVLRRYLGDRYGYDGLESTTPEALAELRRVAVPLDVWIEIQRFMQDADLVKFARRTPTEAECTAALSAAESIIGRTRPYDVPTAEPERAPADLREGAPPP